jgi:hypothetical protein
VKWVLASAPVWPWQEGFLSDSEVAAAAAAGALIGLQVRLREVLLTQSC